MRHHTAVRLGINLMAWSAEIDLGLFPVLKEIGYDGVELPIFAPERIDAPRVCGALADAGLAATASSALPPGASLLDPGQRAVEGVRFLRRTLELCAAIGAELLCGPLYAPVGELAGRPHTEGEWRSCVAALRTVGLAAEELGLRVALEPLNRYESYFLNTAEDGRRLVDAVGHPAVGLHLDTFHMNVEEKDPAAAIACAGERLYHFHCSENDRGVVGSGQVPWRRVRGALEAAGYRGWLVNETFNGRLPELAAATAIWRPLVPDPLTYARESLAFLRSLAGTQE
jgi:D-psicose/D-tagatose/L-ribulose 3-epimerase